MENKYFRVTAYHPIENISIIADSNGKFNQLWELSSYLLNKGFEIISVSKSENLKEVNITIPKEDKDHIIIRAIDIDKPEIIDYEVNNKIFDAIKVADKIYIPKIN